ncbi:MAG TPA: ABC transporter ATP-binding protein [Caldilineaceae bacterium]|nr:ABC transporter ATP-binding protein [Caldilineaceae bacterium]
MSENVPLLEVRELRTHFFLEAGTVRAVDGVSFTIHRGKTLGIVGESGCGKSVAARSILRLVRPPGKIVSGSMLYHRQPRTNEAHSQTEIIDLAALDPDGAEIRHIRGNEIAMIFQEPMSTLSPVHTIGNQMIETIRLHQGVSPDEARARAIEMLRRVGMPQPDRTVDRYRHELSGGMRQRAMIALALSCRPALLIADEPTTALDVTTQAQILELMKDLQEEFGMAIMFITHDLGVIAEMADDVIVMYLGHEVEAADVDTLFYAPKHPYTRALLRSIPRIDQRVESLHTIEGMVPDPYSIPAGCRFHPRCPYYLPEVCTAPPLVRIGKNHVARCARVFDAYTEPVVAPAESFA